MLTNISLVLTLAVALAACGGIRVEQPKDQGDQSQGGEPRVGEAHDEAPKADPAESTEPAEIKPIPANDTAADGEPAIYSPVERSWAAAVDATPAGYHLATRAELVDLIDVGTVMALGGADAELWSSSEQDERIALFVDGDSGRAARMDKTMPMQAIYLKGDL